MMKRKIVFLGAGGTIAGQSESSNDGVGYLSAQVGIKNLLDNNTSLLFALNGMDLECEQVAQVDSKDMHIGLWQRLHSRTLHHLQSTDVAAVVITHGTDTLEETAFFLSLTLTAEAISDKAVVLTCAMRPSTADLSDGPTNLCDAVAVARDSSSRGVLAVCAGSVHAARHVQKAHPYRLDPFTSGEFGPLGFVEEGQVRWQRAPCMELLTLDVVDKLSHPASVWPRVEIVTTAVGTGAATLRSLCAPPSAPDAPVKGVVVAGTGNGTVSSEVEAAICAARANGLRVVVTTRCTSGQLVCARGRSPHDPTYLGLTLVKARIVLMLELLSEKQKLDL